MKISEKIGKIKMKIKFNNIFTLCLMAIVMINFFENSLFGNFIANTQFGVNPVPIEWLYAKQNQYEKNNVKVEWDLTPAFYLTNWPTDIVIKSTTSWEKPTNPAEKIFYLQDEIPSLFTLNLNYAIDNFNFYLELPVEKEYGNKLLTLNKNNNVPMDFSVDLNFPKNAYLYYSNEFFYAAVGRYKISWGDSRYPIHISPTTSQDNVTFSIKFPGIVYTFHSISSFPLLTREEEAIQTNYSDKHTAGRYFKAPSKYIFAHRLDFYHNIDDQTKLRIGLGELNIVGGKIPDIIDFSPALIYHNTYGEGWSNVTGSVDFALSYRDLLKLYGEFVLDDLISPSEIGSRYKPGAYGYSIGTSVKFGENTEFWVEYGETSEWMYVTNYLPYLRINVRKFYIQSTPGNRFLIDYPLGFIYGPDAKMFSMGFRGGLKEFGISYVLEYNYLVKGQVNDNGVIRWKWFWDGWPWNVSESGSTTPPKAADAIYNICTIKINYGIFTLLAKFINFENYFLGLNIATPLGF